MATSSNTPKGYATRAPCRNPPLKADSVILQQTLSGPRGHEPGKAAELDAALELVRKAEELSDLRNEVRRK